MKRDKHLVESITRPREATSRLQSLSIVMNCDAIMQSSINKSRRISIQNLSLTLNRMRLSMDFSMSQLICRSLGISILLCPALGVVTFNFKFSEIITAFYSIQFFLLLPSASSLGGKKIYCVRMDGKIVSGPAIVGVHFYIIQLII